MLNKAGRPQALYYYPPVINILCATYFVTSLTLPNPESSDKRQIRYMMPALPLASARLSKLLISFLNHLLYDDLRDSFFAFHRSSFLLPSITIS